MKNKARDSVSMCSLTRLFLQYNQQGKGPSHSPLNASVTFPGKVWSSPASETVPHKILSESNSHTNVLVHSSTSPDLCVQYVVLYLNSG